MQSEEMKLYWVWLKSAFYDNVKIHRMLEIYKNPKNIFAAKAGELEKISYITERDAENLKNKDLRNAKKIIEKSERHGVEILCFDNEDYPLSLKNVYDAPVVLYLKGKRERLKDELKIAIVGTRKCNEDSMNVCEKLAFDIAGSGGCVVSGMAEGIDSAAHLGALKSGGNTIAVFGTAVNKIYPSSNINLYNEIIKNGLVISEYPPDSRASKFSFQRRNRIIAGLSSGVVVGQAPEKSGSLITARMALDSGRDVFAVPGNACKESYGSNALIRDGCAKIVLSASDILEEYGRKVKKDKGHILKFKNASERREFYNERPDESAKKAEAGKKYDGLSEEQMKVVEKLLVRNMFLDELCEELDTDFKRLGALLTEMEILDIISNVGGKISLK